LQKSSREEKEGRRKRVKRQGGKLTHLSCLNSPEAADRGREGGSPFSSSKKENLGRGRWEEGDEKEF